MSIRYKLFLVVGILFFAIFMGTFFVEFFLSRKGLDQAKSDINSFYVNIEEYKRVHINNYLSSTLSSELGEINSLLEVIAKFPKAEAFFTPSKENMSKGTWKNAASLMEMRNRIGFLQNTYQNKVLSLVVPQNAPLKGAVQIPMDGELCWVMLEDQQTDPYVGIPLSLKSTIKNEQRIDSVPGMISTVYVLYEKKALEKIPLTSFKKKGFSPQKDASLMFPFLQGYSLDLKSFFLAMQQAQDFLKQKQAVDAQSKIFSAFKETKEYCGTSLPCLLDRREQYTDELFMIWQLASLLEEGIMGSSWDGPYAPKGISYFPGASGNGRGFYVKTVFGSAPVFPDQSHYTAHSSKDATFSISSGVALIPYPAEGRLFLGNTAQVICNKKEEKTGFITMGFDLDIVLSNLSRSFHQVSVVISEGKIVSVIDPEGKKIQLADEENPAVDLFLQAPSGVASWHNEKYYFIHMQPYSEVDLHFILLNPAAKEFSLMNQLNQEIQRIIEKVNMDRRYVIVAGLLLLIICLLNITKKMTKPVIALAEAAKEIQMGHLNELQLPQTHFGKRNEIQKLCDAFQDMVRGLKEKEKVKGILNKVVSQDIAKEILKGEVHLGGEEKLVTIFFADIRNFTQITQKMSPKEAIYLINTCMTKVATIIDRHHGVIDKYVGDEIMVLFGAPIARQDSTYQAILSAMQINEDLRNWNEERKRSELPLIEMGIGIHTGKVLAGNMGSENRLNYTVIGSNVNLASRLCSAAKEREILISEETWQMPLVAEKFEVEDMGDISLKGFDASHHVFKIKGIKK